MGKAEKKNPQLKDGKVSKPKSKLKKEKKCKEEKHFALVPRLRLEPRLTPASSSKNLVNEDMIKNIEKDKKLVVSLNTNEISEHLINFSLQEALSYANSHSSVRSNDEQESEISDTLNISFAESNVCESTMDGAQSSMQNNDTEKGDDSRNIPVKKRRKRLVRKGLGWKDRELKDLAIGLQSQGFADVKKVADFVKTKNENDIRVYIRPRIVAAREDRKSDCEKHRGRPVSKWTTVSHENLQTWPNVRKWRKLAYEQMLLYTRSKDYSRPVISSLCKRFYEEEEEPADPQVINVKLIYKYMMDCVAGQIPPQLPPKESSLVLDMLREVRLMPIAYDFEEERKFLQEFKGATSFKPFEVKDEFKKRLKRAPDNEVCGPNVVSVPEEVFLDLSRHKKLVQSFNPLVTPVWMLQKEQEYLEKYYEESNVYVD